MNSNDSKFECFAEISDEKYSIVLDDKSDLTLISFTDIYPKLQQSVRIALNIDIDFNTHEFEVFENCSTKGSLIRVMNQFVRHKSVIRINPKSQPLVNTFVTNQSTDVALTIPTPQMAATFYPTPQPLLLLTNPMTFPITVTQTTPQTITPQRVVNILPNLSASSNSTNSVPRLSKKPNSSSLKVQKNSNIRKRNFYCKVCPILLDSRKNCDLFPYKTTLKMDTFKRYRHLLRKVAEVCDNKYHSLTNNDWNKVIPNKMIGLGYSGFTPQEWRNSFHSFLEEYSQVLKVSPNPEIACNLFPFFHIFNSFVFETKEYYFKRIQELKDKLKLIEINSSQKSLSLSNRALKTGIKTKDFESCVQTLKSSESSIKAYHSMVMGINIGWNFRENGDKYWKLLADTMTNTGDKYKFIVTSEICKTRFYMWTQFYAQNYEKLNSKLEPNHQKFFDLLKIVHTLDLTQLFSTDSSTYQRIKDISMRKELREYFTEYLNQIRIKKLTEIEEVDTNHIDNCETTHATERPKFRVRMRILPKKRDTNVRIINTNNGKQVLMRKTVGNELNFIAIRQTPDPRLRKVVDRAKQFLSKQAVKHSTDNNRPNRAYRPILPKVIETIVLD